MIDYSSAFKTVIPHKLSSLGPHPKLGDWLFNFLTGRPQCVWRGNATSASSVTYTGVPQGCVRSPVLHVIHPHCVPSHPDSIILKFADDTAVKCCITDRDEENYRREVNSFLTWFVDNNLTLNTDKTEEMILDKTNERRPHKPLFIQDLEVERVESSFEYLYQ